MRTIAPTVPVGAVSVMAVTETEVTEYVSQAWRRGEGGSIVTVNVDILRSATKDTAAAELIADAEIVVADGMPLIWATTVSGRRLPDRVTGASLVWRLAEAAAQSKRSVYLIGGDTGIPEGAALALLRQFPGLRVVGTESPPFGFEKDEQQMAEIIGRVARARPDLVLVGLGFPKQENLIARLRGVVPRAWMLGCGAGIPLAAGQFRRAPEALQRIGLEWVHRLVLEPRRLARRYLMHDLPFAVLLLASSLGVRMSRRPVPEPTASTLLPAPPRAQEG